MKVQSAIAGALCLALAAPVGFAGSVLADEKKEPKARSVNCRMTFNLRGWSAFYKTSKGDGTITCDNGQTAKVSIRAKGGGITFGKSEVIGGSGKFSAVGSIGEVFGSYAQSEAHAGAGKSADAQALTKGEVSLVLSGTGRGVDVGFAFGKFTIEGSK